MEKFTNINKSQRIRSSNWTSKMKESLRQLVEPKLKIIDAKENNTKFIKLKFHAWKRIEENMKALGYDIPAQRLKEQWFRMKKQARSNIADYKSSKYNTGGEECSEEQSVLDFLICQVNPNELENCEILHSNNELGEQEEEEENTGNEVENKEQHFINNEKNDDSKRKRKTASSQAGEKMINCRTELIEMEREHEQALFNIRLEMEEMKKKHLEKINELELQIKEEELQAHRKKNDLLNLKLERERRLI